MAPKRSPPKRSPRNSPTTVTLPAECLEAVEGGELLLTEQELRLVEAELKRHFGSSCPWTLSPMGSPSASASASPSPPRPNRRAVRRKVAVKGGLAAAVAAAQREGHDAKDIKMIKKDDDGMVKSDSKSKASKGSKSKASKSKSMKRPKPTKNDIDTSGSGEAEEDEDMGSEASETPPRESPMDSPAPGELEELEGLVEQLVERQVAQISEEFGVTAEADGSGTLDVANMSERRRQMLRVRLTAMVHQNRQNGTVPPEGQQGAVLANDEDDGQFEQFLEECDEWMG